MSARLLLILILIFRPLRQAEWRDSSGGQARSAVRRSRIHREEVQRSKPEAMPPDETRNEGTPSPSERAERWGKPFFAYFFEAFPSVSGYLSPLLIDSNNQEGEGE